MTVVAVENYFPCQNSLFPLSRLVLVSPFREEIDNGSMAVSAANIWDLRGSHDDFQEFAPKVCEDIVRRFEKGEAT